jgi:hypothetical protein
VHKALDRSRTWIELRARTALLLLLLPLNAAIAATATEARPPRFPYPAANMNVTSIPGQSGQPGVQAFLARCWATQLQRWMKSQQPSQDPSAVERKEDELIEGCYRWLRPLIIKHLNPIGLCDRGGIEGSESPGNDKGDDLPQACQSRDASTGATIDWLRVHLRGGYFGDLPDPMLNELRPLDGSIAIYSSAISQAAPGTEVPIDEQLQRRNRILPQGAPPDSLYALLHKRGNSYKLLPLNYSYGNPTHLEMPWNPAQLAAVYDAHLDKYLLYPAGLQFLSPSWNPSLPSWQKFYVWWFDARHDQIERELLPAGPWVADARLDGPLRDARNFSCGTDCYRDYAINVDAGSIFVVISGRPSAISASVTGTYQLSPGSTEWRKIKN